MLSLNLYDIRYSFVARLLFHAMLLLCLLFFFLCGFIFSRFVAILARRRDLCLFLLYNSNLISSNLSIRQRRRQSICVCEPKKTISLIYLFFFFFHVFCVKFFLKNKYKYVRCCLSLNSDLIRLLTCTSLYISIYKRIKKTKIR